MDGTLRISTAMGLVSGVWLPFSFTVLHLLPEGGSPPPIDSYFPVWAFYIVGPIIGLVGAILLLFQRMTRERRGIVGFIVFFASLPSIFFILIYTTALVYPRLS